MDIISTWAGANMISAGMHEYFCPLDLLQNLAAVTVSVLIALLLCAAMEAYVYGSDARRGVQRVRAPSWSCATSDRYQNYAPKLCLNLS